MLAGGILLTTAIASFIECLILLLTRTFISYVPYYRQQFNKHCERLMVS